MRPHRVTGNTLKGFREFSEIQSIYQYELKSIPNNAFLENYAGYQYKSCLSDQFGDYSFSANNLSGFLRVSKTLKIIIFPFSSL